jgi:hypothetical protein
VAAAYIHLSAAAAAGVLEVVSVEKGGKEEIGGIVT